jgi:superfamily II DNA or RNA helicase
MYKNQMCYYIGRKIMLDIQIENDIRINTNEIPYDVMRLVTAELTWRNPAYDSAMRMGRSVWNIPEHIHAYRVVTGTLYLPRGYLTKLTHLLSVYGVEYEIIDNRITLPSVPFDSRIQLREYQIPAVESLMAVDQGGLCAPCGSGKTQMGLQLIARVGQPALWITHTKELAEQTISRVVDCLGIPRDEIGFIGDGKWTVGDRLTVALVQTLARRDLSDIVDRFGCVVVDEAHHLAARTFFDTVGQFAARYRYWLTATPERSDGLTDMITAVGGPIMYTVPSDSVPTIRPVVQIIETAYTKQIDDFSKQIGNLIGNRQRNELIVRTIAETAPGHFALVLSDRVEHVQVLCSMVRRALPDARVAILHGGLSKAERERIMQAAQNREIDILFATKLAKEGLDLPHLDRLYLTCPKRSAATLEQEIGRVMRPCDGKADAVVYDFWDSRNPVLLWQARQREKVYRRMGMTVTNREVKQYA